MSHFTVVVCADKPESLDSLLAPYDENLEVEPYRDYEEGDAAEHWLYRSLKRADEDERNGTGILPYKPDEIGWSNRSSKETPAEQRRKIEADAALYRSLSVPVTWAEIARLYNERYDDDDRLQVDETGRAYSMSTRNPDAKWDYWRIGGRWRGYFRYRPECAAEILSGERGWDSPETVHALHCDGGPKRALDLDALREEKADAARKSWEAYHAIVDTLPEGKPWASFTARIGTEDGYTIEHARRDYHEQPRMLALKDTEFQYYDDPIAEYGTDVRLHAEKARAAAVPGFALVTLDGKWMAPGRMGWFAATDATDSTRIGYWEAANAYIEALPDDAWLIAVDCHI